MKNRINTVFDASLFNHVSFADKRLFVVDYTEQTASTRSVEVHSTKPDDIEALIIHNPTEINISTSIFTPHCFKDKNGNEPKQCECVMSPECLSGDSWILFIEIKNCKPKNVSKYHKDVKEKIIENVQMFRNKGILDNDKIVYAAVSFPRNAKTDFHKHLIKATEWKQFRDSYKIIVKGTNEITVKNDKRINL